MSKTTVINLFAGPGAGKSTTAARIFAALKMDGVSCELVTEFAKDKVWEESERTLENQIYIFAKQYHRMWRLAGKVDFIVTDSPLLLSLVYGNEPESFHALVRDVNERFVNLNFFVPRNKPYVEIGRQQTEAEARHVDAAVLRTLLNKGILFHEHDTYEGIIEHCRQMAKT